METRNISLTLDKAREWYNSGNEALKEAALQVFSLEELYFDFTKIKCFKDVLQYPPCSEVINFSKACDFLNDSQRALVRLNLIRKVLNKGYDIKATEGNIYYPFNPLMTLDSDYYEKELENKTLKKIADVLVENKEYVLLGGAMQDGSPAGLLYFHPAYGMTHNYADIGFLGCATKKIAKHMSLYFAKEIFDAKYKGWLDYKWL